MADTTAILKALVRRTVYGGFSRLYPDEGAYSRDLYPKHMQFFEAGAHHRERAAIAGNRVGKSEGLGGYETAVHLTGRYPEWWPGRRFSKPIHAWAAGQTGETTRDIVQAKLLGPPGNKDKQGTGLLPLDSILETRPRTGIPDAVGSIRVRHVSGGVSTVDLKAYDQGYQKFTGTHREVVWCDEEPPQDVYAECLARTIGTGKKPAGMVLCTFTPLEGMSEVVQGFLKGQGWYITIAQDEVPHLDREEIEAILSSFPAYQREARKLGKPVIGAGKIWAFPEANIFIEPFDIPLYWPKGYALDVGWNCTAAVWGAKDQHTGVTYIYATYKAGEERPETHVHGIKSKGEWMQGAIDPAAQGRSQRDGEQLIKQYKGLGLRLTTADNRVTGPEGGLFHVEQAFSAGTLRIFSHLADWRDEWQVYRRDKNGKVVKENDHLMDCTRYLMMTPQVMTWEPSRRRSTRVIRSTGVSAHG